MEETTFHLQDVTNLQRAHRRAPAACELCRWKKVRCDSRERRPCSNCVFEKVRCVLPPRRPRKISRRHNNPRPASRPSLIEEPEDISLRANQQSPVHIETIVSTQAQLSPIKTSSTAMSESSFESKDPRNWTSSDLEPLLSRDSLGPPIQINPRNASAQSGYPSRDLPDYVKPLPTTMGREDIEYLRVKGALSLPESELLSACLRSYFQNSQPMYPVVDAFKVMSIVQDTNSDNEKLSLLLLQALIFVGATWVDVRLVRKLGFLSRKAFRRTIHRKIRLLYDADYEDDRICLIQTFIICTFWWEGPNENKDAWYWLGVALSLSRTIGLHQSSPNSTMTSAERRLRKRLWWALVTRDTIGSFGLSRSPRISDTDYNVPFLEVEDFEFQTVPDSLTDSIPQSVSQQRTYAQLCITWVKLVCIFGKIFKAAYPESGAGKTAVLYSNQQLEGTDKMPSEARQLNMDQLKQYEKELSQWQQEVPDHMWHAAPLPSSPAELERAELAHRGLLSMLYYTALIILHRPQRLPSDLMSTSTETSETPVEDNSRAMVKFAAGQITKIAMDFYEADMVDVLSGTCISCLIPASINHIFDMTSPNQIVRLEAHQRLEQCKAIFQSFSDQQYAGPWSLNIINHIVGQIHQQNKANQMSGAADSFAVSNTVNLSSENLAGALSNELGAFSTKNPLPLISSCERSTNGLANSNDVAEINTSSGEPVPSLFSALRNPNSTTDASLPMLALDQPPPGNFANFLGPESMWLDFVSAAEYASAFNWTDGNLVP